MVSQTSNSPLNSTVQSFTLGTQAAPVSTGSSTDSFAQELATSIENYLEQSGGTGQFNISIQAAPGQNSNAGQFTVTVTGPATSGTTNATAASTTPGATSPTPTSIANDTNVATSSTPSTSIPAGASQTGTATFGQTPATPFQSDMQQFEEGWEVLNPEQVAFQLANAGGAGVGNPTDLVPGTTMAFGDLNQTQQFAYQYALNYGTGGLTMQDYLTQSAGPQTGWNLSFNQIQQNPDILAAASPNYQVGTSTDNTVTHAQNQSGAASSSSAGVAYLPNPAMIQYLPADQQAAAWAAVNAEGTYGEDISAAVQAYTQATTV